MNCAFKRLLSCLLLCLALGGARAEDLPDLYSAEVAVPDQASASQDRAIGTALRNVLVKLSGQRNLPETATPQLLQSRARSGLQSVTYHDYKIPIDSETEFSELRIRARFDSDTIKDTLVNLGLQRWPAERMHLQFVMALESEGARRMITSNDQYLAFVAADTAGQRGLPLDVSLEPADQEFDISWLQEIWGGFTETPLAEARAQGFDGVLLTAASQRNGRWQLRWNMAIPDREWTWSTREMDLHQALADGIHEAADKISSHAAIDAVDQGRWLEPVEVTNIRNNRDYLRCMEYLQSLNLVNRVHIVSVQGERIHFQLELNAAPEYLHESIDRGDFLNLVGASMHAEARIYEMATP